jgi:hypothetical protein
MLAARLPEKFGQKKVSSQISKKASGSFTQKVTWQSGNLAIYNCIFYLLLLLFLHNIRKRREIRGYKKRGK